jgi:hypothetical protein
MSLFKKAFSLGLLGIMGVLGASNAALAWHWGDLVKSNLTLQVKTRPQSVGEGENQDGIQIAQIKSKNIPLPAKMGLLKFAQHALSLIASTCFLLETVDHWQNIKDTDSTPIMLLKILPKLAVSYSGIALSLYGFAVPYKLNLTLDKIKDNTTLVVDHLDNPMYYLLIPSIDIYCINRIIKQYFGDRRNVLDILGDFSYAAWYIVSVVRTYKQQKLTERMLNLLMQAQKSGVWNIEEDDQMLQLVTHVEW